MNPISTNLALYASAIFLWFAVNYLSADPLPAPATHRVNKGVRNSLALRWKGRRRWFLAVVTRSCAGGLALVTLVGWHAWILGLAFVLAALALPIVRRYLVSETRLAEFEVLFNLAFAALAFDLIDRHGLHLRANLGFLLERWPRLPNFALSAGLLIFLARGGTFIVRGVLARGGTMPPDPSDSSAVDLPSPTSTTIQLNHGRLIGIAERLILALLVANGQYASVAFFFAAKGLIRSKDLELRAWADYLLLGSLTSFLTALIVGILMAQVLGWK